MTIPKITLPRASMDALRHGRKPESALRRAENYFRRFRDPHMKITLPRLRCLEEESAA